MSFNNIIGLDKNHSPFLYFDRFINTPNWIDIHTEASLGIAKSHWDKRYVSAGVHADWEQQEITPYIRDYKKYLNEEQQIIFESLILTEEKIKFMNCFLSIPHPFWIVYLRNNKRIERTGIQNKSVSDDSYWTENAKYFPTIIKFIEEMPFESIGRIIIFLTEANNQTVPHFDAGSIEQRKTKPNDDFIWFKTTEKSKNIFVMDSVTKEKHYPVDGNRFIWFNEMDYHGTDATPGFTFSIRIDGKFLPNVKKEILGI